jgi:hypothetical protein
MPPDWDPKLSVPRYVPIPPPFFGRAFFTSWELSGTPPGRGRACMPLRLPCRALYLFYISRCCSMRPSSSVFDVISLKSWGCCVQSLAPRHTPLIALRFREAAQNALPWSASQLLCVKRGRIHGWGRATRGPKIALPRCEHFGDRLRAGRGNYRCSEWVEVLAHDVLCNSSAGGGAGFEVSDAPG